MSNEQGATGGFDLSTARDVSGIEDQGTVIEMLDEVGEPIMWWPEGPGGESRPVTMTIVGTYSKRYRRAMDAQNTKMAKMRQGKLTGAVLAENRLVVLSKCVIDWDGFLDSGVKIPCVPENAKAVFKKAPHFQEQAESATGDHEAFFSGPSEG